MQSFFSLNLHLLLILLRLLCRTLQNFSDFLLVDGLARIVEFELVFGTSHSEYFEAVDLGDEFWRWWKRFIKVLKELFGYGLVQLYHKKVFLP